MPEIPLRSGANHSEPTVRTAGSRAGGNDHSDGLLERATRSLLGARQAADPDLLLGTASWALEGGVISTARDAGVPSAARASNRAMSDAQPAASAARCHPG